MFDVKAARAEIEAEHQEYNSARAKPAKPANDEARISHISRFSKLPGNSVPSTACEIAEQKIGRMKLHDDRVFLRRRLLGTYGDKRLAIVNRYLEEWRAGEAAEPVVHHKENAGRFRANSWLRDLDIQSLTQTNREKKHDQK